MMRVVLDTNVIVSALISPFGNESLVVGAVLEGRIVPCFSREILAEYSEVLARPKFGFSERTIAQLIAALKSKGVLLAPTSNGRGSADPDDEIFIACALAAKVDYLVTGDRRHFPAEACHPAKVVSAGELLEVLRIPGD